MVNQYLISGILVGVFFAGIGVGAYTVNLNTMNSSHSKDMTLTNYITAQTPLEQHEMMQKVIEHIMEDEHLREHMLAHVLENQQLIHETLTLLSQDPQNLMHMKAHVTSNMTGFEFSEGNQ